MTPSDDPQAEDERVAGPILGDPRRGDVEDDASSTKQRSLFSLAGNLLVEISLPRLLVAWGLLLLLPGLLLGATPIAVSVWIAVLKGRITSLAGTVTSVVTLLGYAVILATLLAVGWYGWRPLLRLAERNFWSLNSLIVQPIYATFREVLRHLAERWLPAGASAAARAGLRAITAGVSGVIVSGLAVLLILWAWPSAHLFGGVPEIGSVRQLAVIVLSNSVVLTALYLAVAALIWAVADATMAQPRDLAAFHASPVTGRSWRVAHLSDIHIVGERYGFRIESGRLGPQGNERWVQVLRRLAEIHATAPLDIILITGDMTDAGRSAEWAEFEDALAAWPALAALTLILPGNHDVNIVDRANPARLDLPTSPNRRLRLARSLAAMARLQGARVHVVDADGRAMGGTLAQCLAPHQREIAQFMSTGSPRLTRTLPELWGTVFPMVLPPAGDDGLGVIILNSNAVTHFSFTNALGMITGEETRRMDAALSHWPRAVWIVAVHHHIVEYPRPAKALSERIGTALINGNWFIRRLRREAKRLVVMHGHRHIDWIGECADLLVVSAPSPVMEVTNETATYFYVHTLAAPGGRVRLLAPERIGVPAPG